jgi:hypothetical protein
MDRTRIAVIDSGVHQAHPHIVRAPSGGFPENDYLDRLGHGTAVMAAIQSHAPDADYYAVKIFDRELRTNIETLIAALDWCIANRMDVINLSLGTPRHAGRFTPYLTQAKIISAAGTNPGDLEGAIRVAADPTLPRTQFRQEANTYYASPNPRPIEGVPQSRNLSGISFAVANLTGLLIKDHLL